MVGQPIRPNIKPLEESKHSVLKGQKSVTMNRPIWAVRLLSQPADLDISSAFGTKEAVHADFGDTSLLVTPLGREDAEGREPAG
jgi:hypothetical protein